MSLPCGNFEERGELISSRQFSPEAELICWWFRLLAMLPAQVGTFPDWTGALCILLQIPLPAPHTSIQ